MPRRADRLPRPRPLTGRPAAPARRRAPSAIRRGSARVARARGTARGPAELALEVPHRAEPRIGEVVGGVAQGRQSLEGLPPEERRGTGAQEVGVGARGDRVATRCAPVRTSCAAAERPPERGRGRAGIDRSPGNVGTRPRRPAAAGRSPRLSLVGSLVEPEERLEVVVFDEPQALALAAATSRRRFCSTRLPLGPEIVEGHDVGVARACAPALSTKARTSAIGLRLEDQRA